jgi:hypothetical protein
VPEAGDENAASHPLPWLFDSRITKTACGHTILSQPAYRNVDSEFFLSCLSIRVSFVVIWQGSELRESETATSHGLRLLPS